jgi:hypothetical protein
VLNQEGTHPYHWGTILIRIGVGTLAVSAILYSVIY